MVADTRPMFEPISKRALSPFSSHFAYSVVSLVMRDATLNSFMHSRSSYHPPKECPDNRGVLGILFSIVPPSKTLRDPTSPPPNVSKYTTCDMVATCALILTSNDDDVESTLSTYAPVPILLASTPLTKISTSQEVEAYSLISIPICILPSLRSISDRTKSRSFSRYTGIPPTLCEDVFKVQAS